MRFGLSVLYVLVPKIVGPNYGTTIFFTTHCIKEAESRCDRVAIMHVGKLVALGTCEELKGAIGGADRALDDVFAFFAGTALDVGGNYRDVSAERAVARRLG